MAKITADPPVERKFQVEVTELELRLIAFALGRQSQATVDHITGSRETMVLPDLYGVFYDATEAQ